MSGASFAVQLVKGGATTFDPSNAGPLAAWYRSDQGITQSGGTVSQWSDLSGNARHLTQATSANQPAYGAISGANSLPGLTFANASSTSMAVTFTAIGQPIHLFTVVKIAAYGSNQGIVCGGSIGECLLCEGDVSGANPDIYMGGPGISFATSDTTTFALWECLANTTSSSIIRGNGSAVTGSVGSNTLSGITLGRLISSAFSSCVISEVALYSAAVAGTNLTSLRAYFALRYGVATN